MPIEKPGRNSKETGKEPFVPAAYDPKDDAQSQPKKTIAEITKQAQEKVRFKKSLHQRYDSKLTKEITEATERMLGEKNDDERSLE